MLTIFDGQLTAALSEWSEWDKRQKAVATLNSSNLVQPITSSSGRPTTRLFQATFAAAHCFDHYGQMIEYLRMNGIVPPASRGQ
jgi:hypothetical protein